MTTICSPFSSQVITSNFSSVLIVFRQFCTWIAPSDVDLCFLLILMTKASAVERGELYQPCDSITNIINPYRWLMVWQWCQFLLASTTRQVWAQIAYAKTY